MLATPAPGEPASPLPATMLGATVRRGPVPAALPGGVRLTTPPGMDLWATETSVLYRDARAALLVEGTSAVTVEWDDDLPPSSVAAHVYGFVARVLLIHAGRFSLHASVVDTGHGVVAIGGDSGAGKSTTAAGLLSRGARLVIDDVAPLRTDDGLVVVESFARPVHLFAHAAERFGLTGVDDPPGPAGPRGKLALDVAEPATQAVLDALVVLEVRDDDEPGLVVRPVTGGDRMQAVVRLSNATGLASLGPRAQPFFAWAAAVADRLPVYRVTRPAVADTHDAVVDAVLALAQSAGHR